MTSPLSIVSGSGSLSNRVLRRVAMILTVGLVLVGFVHVASAQATTRIAIAPGFNDGVRAISEPDATGTRYLGGSFTAFDAWNTGGGALTNATSGAVDTSFPNVDGVVFASAADGDGGFYIGGSFTHVDGVARNNAAHINADGFLDRTWNPDANDAVYAIAVSGSTIYLGGHFTTINGTPRNHTAAVPANGSLDLTWNPNANDTVYAIAVSGSTIYLGGQFTTINDSTRYRAAAVGADGAVLGQWPTAYVPAVTPPVVPPVVPPVAPPVVARVLPAAPTKLHWLVGDGTTNQPIVTTFTAAPGTTYTISGTLATSKAFGTRASKPTRGTCKIATNKKTNKRTAKCTIPLRKAGTWLVSITPAQAGVKGPPATKTIKIRAATKKTRTLPIYQRGILAQP